MNLNIFIFIVTTALVSAFPSYSSPTKFQEHFVYLKSPEVNMRSGPSKKYPIKWVIKSLREPLKVSAKFEEWIKVRDVDGDEGWVMSYFTSSRLQGAVIISNSPVLLYKKPDLLSPKIAKLKKNVRVKIIKCQEENWCNISINDFKGWVLQRYLWGI